MLFVRLLPLFRLSISASGEKKRNDRTTLGRIEEIMRKTIYFRVIATLYQNGNRYFPGIPAFVAAAASLPSLTSFLASSETCYYSSWNRRGRQVRKTHTHTRARTRARVSRTFYRQSRWSRGKRCPERKSPLSLSLLFFFSGLSVPRVST